MASLKLTGKVALVTGGAQGLGLATVHMLLNHGAKVGVLDVMAAQLDSTCKLLEQQYGTGKVQGLLCDVTDSKKLVEMFAKTKETFGSLDIVCNNAGIVDEIDWEKLLSINLNAVILGTKTAIEHMSVNRGGRGGVVINVSSVAGLIPLPKHPIYSASKTALIAYSLGIKEAAEADGVRINCICPWVCDTSLARNILGGSPEIIKIMVKPSMVAEGILELITDTTKSGAVLKVSYEGLAYHKVALKIDPPVLPDFLQS